MTEKSEKARLKKIYKDLPPDKLALVDGLIESAARIRVQMGELWEDLQQNGKTEMFTQNPAIPPYERERPASKMFTAASKNYQSIIKQLEGMMPDSRKPDELKEFF